MNQNEITRNIKDMNQWIRALYMLLFAVILYVVGIVLMVVVVIQALFAVLTGKPNANLQALGSSLSTYIHQTVDYLTYNNEDKPFPFADWPKPSTPATSTDITDAEPESKESESEKAEEKVAEPEK